MGFPRHQQLNGPSRWRLLVGNGVEGLRRREEFGTAVGSAGGVPSGAQPWLKYERARFILAVAAAVWVGAPRREGPSTGGGDKMANDPRLMRLAARLACVALVVSIMFPLGKMLFPYVAEELGTMQFSALEAVLSTTVGFGIYTAFFG